LASSTRCIATAGPGPEALTKWHVAVANVPLSQVVPLGFGAASDTANIAAFYGDKRIGTEVALTLRNIADSDVGVAWLSEVMAEAVSNQMFASRLGDILPVHSKGLLKLAEIQLHDAGTMVEAAIDAVVSAGGVAGEEAVSELASWLVEAALQRGPANTKGKLLEVGGIVTSKFLDGYPDHDPRFLATAQLDGLNFEAEGRSKLEAEQEASARLLLLMDSSFGGFASSKRMQVRGNDTQCSSSGDFIEITSDLAMNLKNGESAQEWWLRGAAKSNSAFYRAVMAPHTFPNAIAMVKCWLREAGKTSSCSEYYTVLVAVVGTSSLQDGNEPVGRSFLNHGKSRTLAKKAAGLAANVYIASEIVCLLLNGDGGDGGEVGTFGVPKDMETGAS
jgi:hypothetical protein